MARRPETWWRWIEPWYLAYALLGAAVGGMVPMVVPLTVHRTGSLAATGLVMAAFNLGGLTAPLWGGLADRYRLHRVLLVGGLLGTTLGLAAFPAVTTLPAWMGLALLEGIGAACAATVANLFVVEAHPQDEWDQRLGWLHTLYAGGQVGGLCLVGGLPQSPWSLWVAAGLTALAVVPGWWSTHTPPGPLTPRPVLRHPAQHAEWLDGSPQRLFHHLSVPALRWLSQHARPPFALFLLAWLVAFIGSSAFFALYPVLMAQLYGIPPRLAASAAALAYGTGLAVYAPAGRWSKRYGPARLVHAALGMRFLAFGVLWGVSLTTWESRSWLAFLGYFSVVLAWPALSVGGTAWTARLARRREGEGLGLFNATTALAGVLGAGLGGWLSSSWGLHAVWGLVTAGVGLGLWLTLTLRPRQAARRRATGWSRPHFRGQLVSGHGASPEADSPRDQVRP